jgi:hypothetical protein
LTLFACFLAFIDEALFGFLVCVIGITISVVVVVRVVVRVVIVVVVVVVIVVGHDECSKVI